MARLYDLFIETDATQVEINPLVETPEGAIVSFDAKIAFDDNAMFRQPKVREMFDPAEEDPREIEAAKYSLNYVPMDGEIGCMVNGAGLAMATMDIISHYGRSPANFLDVGGSATQVCLLFFLVYLADVFISQWYVHAFQCVRLGCIGKHRGCVSFGAFGRES